MTMVYVVTAGSGDSYRIERVYLEASRPMGSRRTTTASPRWNRSRSRSGRIGAPPVAYDGPYWRAEWWARIPVAKRRGALRHTDEGERFDDFAIRQEWWTGEALPEAKVVRRELTGAPKIEVVGLSKEKVEERSGTRSPRPGRPGRSPEEIASAICAADGKKWAWRLDIAVPIRHDDCMD